MADYNLGTARGTIEIDYRGSGAQQATQGLGQVRQASETSESAIRKTGTGFVVAGATIVGALGVAIKSASDFETGLSGIQAVSGATTTEMDAVRKKALQLGADTAFSASDASAAMEELVKAGIPIPSVLNGAADATVALAAAGGIDLPNAAAIAANAMNQFGLSAQEMPKIADKIAGAANASAIDVGDFGQSMSQAGAVAHLAGLSFDDTALAITAMGNAGIKGSDAGTSLKTFLQNLQPQTKAQINLMKQLGIVTADGGNKFFTAAGKVKSMSQIAGVLGGALKGMSDQQKTATLQTLFGSDAIRAAAVIAGQGSQGMDKLSASINKVKAADVAATRMNNLGGQVEQLKGSAETLAIGLGSVFIPALNNVVTSITKLVNWFSSLDAGTQKAIAITAAFVGGLLLFVGGIIKAVQTALAFKEAMLLLNGTFLASPIFWIILAIVALIAALVVLYKNSETFRKLVDAVWQGFLNAVKAVVAWFTGTFVPALQGVWNSVVAGATGLWTSITSIWNSITSAISTAWNSVISFFTSTGSSVSGFFSGLWNSVLSIFSTVWNAIVTVLTTIWNVIVGLITAYVNMWRTIITTALNVILAVWSGIWNLFGPLLQAAWNLISAIFQVAFAWIMAFIQAELNGIMAIWNAVWNAIVAVTSAVWNAIRAVVMAVWGAVSSWLGGVLNALRATFSAVWNAISSVVRTVVNAISAVVMAVWSAIYSRVYAIMSALRSAISSAWNAIRSAVSSVMSAISSVISSLWNAIYSNVSSRVNSIRSIISSVFNAAKAIVASIFGQIASVIGQKIDQAKSLVSGGINAIKGFFSGAGSWLYNAGAKLIGGLIDGIKSMIGKVTGAMNGLADKVRSFLPGSPIKTGPLRDHGWNEGRPGKQLIRSVADGIESDMGLVQKAFSGIEPTLPSTLTSSSVAARLVPVSGLSGAAPAQVAPAGPVTNHFDVTIPARDLAEMQTVTEFFDLAQRRGRQKTGVTR